jgi:transposase-like protein
MPKAFPEEFRRDVIAVARRGEAPISQIAKDFDRRRRQRALGKLTPVEFEAVHEVAYAA